LINGKLLNANCIYTETKAVFGFRKVVIAIPTLSKEVPKEFREQSVNFSLRSTDYLSAAKAGFVIKNIPRNDVEFDPAWRDQIVFSIY